MVVSRYPGLAPEELTAKIVEAMEIANELASESVPANQTSPLQATPQLRVVSPPPGRVIIPGSHQRYPDVDLNAGMLIEAAAPPVVGGDGPASDAPIEYWTAESLRTHIQSSLPSYIEQSISGSTELHSFDLRISTPGSPASFVKVSYVLRGTSQNESRERGDPFNAPVPQVTLLTTTPGFNPNTIMADIRSQIEAMFAERGKAKVMPPPRVPRPEVISLSDIARMSVQGGASDADRLSPQEQADAMRDWKNTTMGSVMGGR
jgi:hypothetical protein